MDQMGPLQVCAHTVDFMLRMKWENEVQTMNLAWRRAGLPRHPSEFFQASFKDVIAMNDMSIR
jgi:hypothetical protein